MNETYLYLSESERQALENAETIVESLCELAQARALIQEYKKKEREHREEQDRQWKQTQEQIGSMLSGLIDKAENK